jgi:hypothetical protein
MKQRHVKFKTVKFQVDNARSCRYIDIDTSLECEEADDHQNIKFESLITLAAVVSESLPTCRPQRSLRPVPTYVMLTLS